MKDRRMPFPTTYPLFQLVRLMSIREDGDSGKSPVVTKYAWIEAGEDNLLALYNSNGKYILTQFFVTLRNVSTMKLGHLNSCHCTVHSICSICISSESANNAKMI